ncbi:hypothetical protein Lal_00011579 [Lupinus albus]|nr:hypothetical protein Lal_00011579 [Lupinus albus]
MKGKRILKTFSWYQEQYNITSQLFSRSYSLTMSSSTFENDVSPNNTHSTTIDKLVVLIVGSQLYIKLDGDNYPLWHLQFLSLLIGYDLLGYIDGSLLCPSKQLETNTNIINPAYNH